MDIPKSINLTPYFGIIALQGAEGTCAENAEYNAILAQTNLAGSPFKIDRQLAYQNVLDAQGHPTADQGTAVPVLWSTGESAGLNADTGVYGPAFIGTQPTDGQVSSALSHKISSTSSVNMITQTTAIEGQIADLLAHYQVPILAFNIRQGYEDGMGINSGALLGGHTVAVCGYSMVPNVDGSVHEILDTVSWGQAYGVAGHFSLDITASFGAGAAQDDLLSVDVINGFNGVDWSGGPNATIVAELYNSLLGRSPETSAFKNMGAAISGGLSLGDACAGLMSSAEGRALLPASATHAQTVSFLYANIQGRSAPDAAGLAFWTGYLDGGGSASLLAAQMIKDTQDSAQWGYNYWAGHDLVLRAASDWLYNRATVSIDIGLHMQDTADTPAHAALLTSVMANVTSDPNSVQAALVGVPELLGHVLMH